MKTFNSIDGITLEGPPLVSAELRMPSSRRGQPTGVVQLVVTPGTGFNILTLPPGAQLCERVGIIRMTPVSSCCPCEALTVALENCMPQTTQAKDWHGNPLDDLDGDGSADNPGGGALIPSCNPTP